MAARRLVPLRTTIQAVSDRCPDLALANSVSMQCAWGQCPVIDIHLENHLGCDTRPRGWGCDNKCNSGCKCWGSLGNLRPCRGPAWEAKLLRFKCTRARASWCSGLAFHPPREK